MAKQNFVGLVVSQGKMNKTVKVRVQLKAYDKRVHKEVLRRKDFLVHDEGNLCKEGDFVRIESIPKITARKHFAVAEIKINKGQQFALYEQLAKEKVAQEDKQRVLAFLARRAEFEKTITQVEDLKTLDTISRAYQLSDDAQRAELAAQIEAIKQKYNIAAWPAPEPVVELEVSAAARDLAVVENRVAHIKQIVEKLMLPEYTQQREAMLEEATQGKYGPVLELRRNIQKNLLRKHVLNPAVAVPNVL